MATKGSCMCGETAYQFTGEYSFRAVGRGGGHYTFWMLMALQELSRRLRSATAPIAKRYI